MTPSIACERAARAQNLSRRVLTGSARLWLCITLSGQVIFAAYVASFYGGAALAGDFPRWAQVLPQGFNANAPWSTAVLGVHLLLAVTWVLGGAVQLLPGVRRWAPTVHRWNGRAYIGMAVTLALSGCWLVWVRGGVVGDFSQHLAITLNAGLILGCAARALHTARSHRFADHRRWALRLFMVASGVWFFRIGLMAWLILHRRPVGFDAETFQGPFLTLLAFGVYVVLPLPLLQAYLTASEGDRPAAQWAVAALIGVLTLASAVGVFGAAWGLWLPRMTF